MTKEEFQTMLDASNAKVLTEIKSDITALGDKYDKRCKGMEDRLDVIEERHNKQKRKALKAKKRAKVAASNATGFFGSLLGTAASTGATS